MGGSGSVAGVKEVDDLDGVVASYHGVLRHVAGADGLAYHAQHRCGEFIWRLAGQLVHRKASLAHIVHAGRSGLPLAVDGKTGGNGRVVRVIVARSLHNVRCQPQGIAAQRYLASALVQGIERRPACAIVVDCDFTTNLYILIINLLNNSFINTNRIEDQLIL